MSDPSQAHRFLKLATTLGRDAVIPVRANGVEALGRMFEVTVEFTATRDDFDHDVLLGTNATLQVIMAGERNRAEIANTRYFNGYFSRITFAGYQREGRPTYRASLVPWLWFLTRKSDCRIFQDKSVREIIKQVFSDVGFSDYHFDLKGSYPTIDFCVQYRETDFQFISRLMEREGIYYHFTHKDGSHLMEICDDMSCHKPEEKFDTISFIGGVAVGDKQGVITDWEFTSEVKPGVYAHNDFNFLTPKPDPNLRLLTRSTAPKPQKPRSFEIYDAPGGFPDLGEGSRYARLRMEELQADREVATGRTNIQGLAAGRKFKFVKHPTKSQNRNYLITSVQWSVHEGASGSGGGGGGEFFVCGFTCIPDDGVFRAARITPVPRIEGLQTATVCGPQGQEIYVDELARVKVQFHWDRYGRSDAMSSCWIRVSQPWAGKGFGGVVVPRIGQEVIVDFIEGDPDRPIINGRVYNGEQSPTGSQAGRPEIERVHEKITAVKAKTREAVAPMSRAVAGVSKGDPASDSKDFLKKAAIVAVGGVLAGIMAALGKAFNIGKVNVPQSVPNAAMMTTIRTNSLNATGGSNEITLNDFPGMESLLVKGQKDLILTSGEDCITMVGKEMQTDVAADRTTTIGGNDTLSVAKRQNITVGKRYSLAVGQSAVVKVRALCQHIFNHNYELTVGKSRITQVGEDVTTRIAGSEVHEVAADSTIRIGANLETEVTYGNETRKLKSGDRFTDLEAGSDNLKAKKDLEYDIGQKIKLTAGDEIEIVCGLAKISMKKNGNIEISGVDVALKSGAGIVQIDAGGIISIKGPMVKINT